MTCVTKNGKQPLPVGLSLVILCLGAIGCNRPSSDDQVGASAMQPAIGDMETVETPEANLPADPFWDGLARNSIQLDQTLLVVRGSKGVAGCTYLNIDTFERAGEVCVILPAADFAGMLDAKVTAATSGAKSLGIEVGMPGREALDILR